MTVRTKLQAGVAKVFTKLDSLTETIVYQQIKLGAYDAITDTSSDSVRKSNVKAMLSEVDSKQFTLNEIKSGDMAAAIEARQINFTPQVNDTVLRGKEQYDVIEVLRDGLNLVHKLHLRKK